MKKIRGTKSRTLGLGMLMATLMATLLFGCAVAKADAALDWNVIAVNTAIASGQNPFAQARTAAIVQLAVFESVNAITGEYHPYLGTIVAPPGASADAAAIEAAYRVLHTYFLGSALSERHFALDLDNARREWVIRAVCSRIDSTVSAKVLTPKARSRE